MTARALLLIGVIAIATPARSDTGGFRVIVNPQNPITAIDRDALRDAYLRKSGQWKHGGAIHPVDLAWKFREREHFTKDVLKKTPGQLKRFYNQQIYSGKGVPPPEVETTAAMINQVLADPDAVGYLPAGADPGGARVIVIK